MESLNLLIENYLDYCKYRKKLSGKTLKAYQIDFKQYMAFIGGLPDGSGRRESGGRGDERRRGGKDRQGDSARWGDEGRWRDGCRWEVNGGQAEEGLSRSILDSYITELHKKYKPKSIKRKIASLKAFFHYLVYIEVLEDNPFSKIDLSFREPKLLPKTIPLHTIQKFLSTLYAQKSIVKTDFEKKSLIRDIAVCELLFATGMRISELCSLSLENIDLKNGSIRILGKGSKERILQIGHKDVLAALMEYKQEFLFDMNACGYFFINRLHRKLSDQSVRFMINKYADMAAIQMHITPHMFRHSFATLLLEQDVDIRYIQRMLGHSSITTTEIYTHVSNVKQKDILLNRHPRNWVEVSGG